MSAPARSRPSLLRDRIDARAMLAYLGVTLVLAFAIQQPIAVAALTAAVWLVLVGVLELAEYRPYLFYGALSAIGVMILNPLVSRAGQTVIWTSRALPIVGSINISAEAVVFGITAGLRLLCVVGLFAMYSILVDPDALYRLISPFSVGSALVVALSIRLLPTSVRDAGRITDAMRSRGLALDTGRYASRVAARGPIMEALLMTSLDRAMGLAESLESRGFGRPGRSRMPMPKLALRDRVMLALTLALAVLGAGYAVLTSAYAYYPVLDDPMNPAALAGAAIVATLAVLPLAFEWGWDAWLSSRSNA